MPFNPLNKDPDYQSRNHVRVWGWASWWFFVETIGIVTVYMAGWTRNFETLSGLDSVPIRVLVWMFAFMCITVGAFRSISYLRHDR